MKKITLLLFLFVSSVIYSQKNGISYQAVIFNPNGGKVPGINNSNEPLANKNICLQFTIIDSDSRTEYQETINTTTDAFGMVNTIIGSGNQSAGYAASFSNIYWTTDQKSLKVAMDIHGKCSSFVEISNQFFTSVPSAFSAQNAENVTGVVSIESGGTNAVTVLGAKTNLALEKVDNTSDLSKPISTATQIVLNLKEDSANKSTDLIIDANSNVKYPTVQAVKTYIDANASTGSAGLAAEIARASAAELTNANAIATNTTAITANTNAIAAEVTTARASELANANAISSETSRATAAEAVLTTNIANEADTRATADASLVTQLTAEATTARASELANADAISSETSRATAAEAIKENTANKSIDGTFASNSDVKFPTEKAVKTYVDTSVSTTSTALATEVLRATAAEGVLTTNIANEASTRATGDATLTTNLNAEVARATVAEGVLTTSIVNEASTRGTADATLTTNLNAEITRATAAEAIKENTANKSIDGTFASNSDVKFPTEKAVKTYVDTSVSTISTALATEVLRATAAEGVMTTSIANEASTRATGDATLTTNLNAEISRATAAETANANAIAAEATTARAAELANATAITAETNRATAAETANATAITAETTRATAAEAVLTTSIANEAGTRATADSSLTTLLTAEATTARASELALTNNLVIEATTARAAELANANAIAAEVTIARAAELANANAIATNTTAITVNANAIAAEVTIARAAELANANAIATNANAIAAEATTARAAELANANAIATNANAIAAEATTARAAELANATAITAETSRATAAEAVLTTSIATETTNRSNADNSLTTNLATEVTNRTNADVLKEDLVNKSTDVTTDGASDIKYPSVKSVKTYVDNTNATNANLTGPITSVGNTTSVASQTGTGSKFVMDTAATLVTPVLGVATATSINGTAIPTSKTLVVTTDKLNALAATTSAELAGIISDETGTGSVVLSDSPIFTGTPSLPTGTMGVTQAAGNNTPALATTAFVKTAISNAIIEVSDEFTATASQTAFTLTQTPSSNSKVKMYVNGIRISNTAYSVSGTTLTYNSANNGTYNLTAGDRIQMDFYY